MRNLINMEEVDNTCLCRHNKGGLCKRPKNLTDDTDICPYYDLEKCPYGELEEDELIEIEEEWFPTMTTNIAVLDKTKGIIEIMDKDRNAIDEYEICKIETKVHRIKRNGRCKSDEK